MRVLKLLLFKPLESCVVMFFLEYLKPLCLRIKGEHIYWMLLYLFDKT